MSSKFFFSLSSIKPQNSYDGGSITHVTSKHVPGFVDISFANLDLKPKGSQEPIWHPNTNKLGYCIQGKSLVTIRTPSETEIFSVVEGDMFFIPQGYIHQITNIGDEDCKIIFAFNNTEPQTMCLAKAIYSLSDNVFNSTFNTQSPFLEGLKKSKNNELIKVLPSIKNTKEAPSSRFKFNINSSNKPVLTKGGFLQLGTKATLSTLKGLGILRFGLNEKGNVEPHWHTNAGELVYIVKGKTRITVLSPGGNVEVMEVGAGEGAFAPASHFHNIENIGSEEVEVVAFFNNENPDYIGIGETVGAFSNEVLTSFFNCSPDYFDKLKKPEVPLIIVPIS